MHCIKPRAGNCLQHFAMIFIPKESVYGKRDGVLHGLGIVHKDDRNLMRQTVGFKTGTILNVKMCPRSEMFKPSVDSWAEIPLWVFRFVLFPRAGIKSAGNVIGFLSLESLGSSRPALPSLLTAAGGVSQSRAATPGTCHDWCAGDEAGCLTLFIFAWHLNSVFFSSIWNAGCCRDQLRERNIEGFFFADIKIHLACRHGWIRYIREYGCTGGGVWITN